MRAGIVRVRGMFGIGVSYHRGMRVLYVQIGPWTLEIEGPQS